MWQRRIRRQGRRLPGVRKKHRAALQASPKPPIQGQRGSRRVDFSSCCMRKRRGFSLAIVDGPLHGWRNCEQEVTNVFVRSSVLNFATSVPRCVASPCSSVALVLTCPPPSANAARPDEVALAFGARDAPAEVDDPRVAGRGSVRRRCPRCSSGMADRKLPNELASMKARSWGTLPFCRSCDPREWKHGGGFVALSPQLGLDVALKVTRGKEEAVNNAGQALAAARGAQSSPAARATRRGPACRRIWPPAPSARKS